LSLTRFPNDTSKNRDLRKTMSSSFDLEDESECFQNKVQLFADILDSPILTTTRSKIEEALTKVGAALYDLQTVGITPGTRNLGEFFSELKAAVSKTGRTTRLENSATEMLGLAVFYDNWTMLSIEERVDIAHRLCDNRYSSSIDDRINDALELYAKVSEGVKQQLGASPMAPVRIANYSVYPELHKWQIAMECTEALVQKRQSDGLMNLPGAVDVKAAEDKVTMVACGDIVGFKLDGSWKMTSWDDFLCIRSMCLYRRNAYLLLAIDSSIPLEVAPAFSKMLAWQEDCVKTYGNKGYELAKATESVFKARLMQISDGPHPKDAYHLMIEKQKQKEASWDPLCPLVTRLADLAQSIVTTRGAAELFGAVKFSGHPYIDPAKASASSKAHGKAKSTAKLKEVMMLRAQFCDMVLRGYIKRHAKWPPLRISESNKLAKLARSKPLVLAPDAYPLENWYFATFDKFMEFDYHIDYLDMMDDKSLGLDSSDAWKAWEELKKENYRESQIPDTRSKKLIIRMLSMSKFDPVAICREMRTLDLTTADLCMALYPKEREFKLEARLFVMLQFQVRYFLTLAERNFKTLMKSYLDNQSMTKGRKGTMQFLEKMASPRQDSHFDTVFIEIDLTRWNLLWQGNVVDHVSWVVDDIFGMPGMFSRGHEIFEASTIVVRVVDELPEGITAGSKPKDWPEGEYVWRGHKGGFEGIIQGQWTACTQAELKLALRDEPIAGYELLGQGDNQVVAITYTRDQSLDRLDQALTVSARITDTLRKHFSWVNQIVKPEECLASLNTVTYSKIIWSGGVQVPTTLKHAATVAPVGTSYIPSIVTGLEALSSGCRASADAFSNPTIAYAYYLILFRDYLARSVKHMPAGPSLQGQLLSKALLDVYSIIPSDLGGLPTLGPCDFLYGGSSDKLSDSIAHLVCGSHWSKLYRWYLGMLESGIPWKKQPDPKALLQDPFAVPIDRAVGATTKIEGAIKTVLPGITRNVDIAPIVSATVDNYDITLSNYLTATRPFYPLLMADVRELSIIGVKTKIQTKFVGTRTIQQLIRGRAPINYRNTVILGDCHRFQRLNQLISICTNRRLTSAFDSKEIFKRAENYRSRWFPNEPNPIRGITTVHPFSARVDIGLTETSPDYIEFITLETGDHVLQCKGPHPGRWGDRTWEHRKGSGVTVMGKEKSVLAAKRLLLLESQLAATGTLKEVLRQVLSQRTTVDLDLMAQLMPTVVGGVAAHRWDSTIESKKFAWLGSIGPTQHIQVQTDSMTSTSGGDIDWLFCFQEHIFLGLQLGRTMALAKGDERLAFRLHYTLTSEHIVESNPVEAPATVRTPNPPPTKNLSDNPLVSARRVIFQTMSSELPDTIAPVCSTLVAESRQGRMGILIHYFLDQLENPLLSELAIKGTEVPSGLSIDVGALKGAGVQDTVMAAGIAVFLRAAEILVSEPLPTHLRSLAFNRDRLASVASLPIARFITAPGVRTQRWVKENGLSMYPGETTASGLSRLLKNQVVKMAIDAEEALPDVSALQIIASSYAERATPSRILGCMIAVAMLIENKANTETARQIYRKHLRVLRTAEGEEQRVALHLALIRAIADDPVFACQALMSRILSGKFIRRLPIGFDESMRLLRRKDAVSAIRTLEESVVVESCRLHTIPRGTPRPVVQEFLSFKDLHVGEKTRADIRLISRNLGWKWGGSSISRHSLPVLAAETGLIRRGTCVLVGVGLGAIGRDLYALGAKKVWGVDLLSHFPKGSSVGTDYVPPEIPQPLPRGAWQWLPQVVTHGGDWFSSAVHSAVCDLEPDLIILDVQDGQRSVMPKLVPLLGKYRGKVICRMVVTRAEHLLSLAIFGASFKSAACWSADTVWPKEVWWDLDFVETTALWTSDSHFIEPRPIPRLLVCPNSFFYPNMVNRMIDQISQGRLSRTRGMEEMLTDCYRNLLDDTLRQKEKSEWSLTAICIHMIAEMMIQEHPFTEAEVIEWIAEMCSKPPPASVNQVATAVVGQKLFRSTLCRIVPRLLEISTTGWTLATPETPR
jgi:phage gp36-like protein